MSAVTQESCADRVRRKRKEEGMEATEYLAQIDWTSETPAYDAIFPRQLEAWERKGCGPAASDTAMFGDIDTGLLPQDDWSLANHIPNPPLLERAATPTRRFRLSRSPLDSLQAEFRRYGLPDRRASLQFAQLPDSPKDISHSLQDRRIQAPQGLKGIDELSLPRDGDHTTLHPDDTEHSDAALVVPDWSFVQRRLEGTNYIQNSDCPSMTTGSTIGSRNSSTRSARSFRPDGVEEPGNGMCPIPECGRMMRDLAAHMLTHQTERPEKCPVQTCEYHTKGFARACDRVRHTLTHFKGAFICAFCPLKSHSTTFGRCDVFLRHLVSEHRVEQVPLSRREELCRTGTVKHPRRPLEGQLVATCELCSEPFDAQGFYEHLRGCVLRQVTRSYRPLGVDEYAQGLSSERHLLGPKASPRNDSTVSGVAEYLVIPAYIPDERQGSTAKSPNSNPTPLQTQIKSGNRNLPTESKEIAELTASSRCLSLTSSHDEGVKSSDEETDWTEDAGSPYSEPDADGLRPLLSPVKRQLVDAIMVEFHRVFDKMLRTHGGGSSNTTGGYTDSSGSSTYSSSSFISRKRSLSGGSTPPPDENGDDPHKRRRPDPKTTGGKQPVPELRFACPYYKRNPGRHQTFTSCRDPGFITVARLKEHLYRRHILPIQCNRCCSTFPNEPMLREHQRDTRGCEIREQIPLEGFDKDQERKLKSKKRSLVYQSEEDKWKGVYRILFPDDVEEAMPSPYIEYQPCHPSQAGESSNIARFQEFSRLELPRLVRRTLEVAVEEEAQPLEDKLKERLVDIVRECQSQLIFMFQTTQVPSNIATSKLALIPALEGGSGLSSQINSQKDSNTTDLSFHGFESIASMESEFLTMPALPDVSEQPKFEAGAEGSPDSGYDSTWHGASAGASIGAQNRAANTFPQEGDFSSASGLFDQTMVFEQQPGYIPATALTANEYTNNEYVHPGGYYGLFENRNNGFETTDSAWTFTAAGGGGAIGSGM